MINCIIVEDEEKSLNVLKKLIAKYFSESLNILGNADSIESGISLIQKANPDLVFLDIELIDGSSFHILKQFPDANFGVIFTTAFDNYAIKAFKFSAIDYLLKPIDDQEFQEAVNRFVKSKSRHQIEQLNNAQSMYSDARNSHSNKLAIRHGEGIVFELISDVLALIADKNYTNIHCLSKKRYTTSKNLGYYDDLLIPSFNFFRIHHSTIVNIDHIQEFHHSRNSHSGEVIMKNGAEYTVSARKLAELKERLNR